MHRNRKVVTFRAMIQEILSSLTLEERNPGTFCEEWLFESEPNYLASFSPISTHEIAKVSLTSERYYEEVISRSIATFQRWRSYPAPKRGELIRQIGDRFRNNKEALARLITLEMGKPISEAEGEVQEVIDICDFATGLSRQLYGLTMHSERPAHRMYEQWHPLGPVGVITAFNFPAAVWAWNTMIAAVCGDTVIWKPSELTPLTAAACIKISEPVLRDAGFAGVFSLITGEGHSVGARLASDRRVPLISATGSTAMGRQVGEVVAKRFGRSLLELGGNNAVIILDDANLELAIRAVTFGAVGTAGQRCTSTRRILAQSGVVTEVIKRLKEVYSGIKVGDPFDRSNLIGPLVSERAVKQFEAAVDRALKEGGELICGGKVIHGLGSPLYVEPTLIRASRAMSIVKDETFAPISYLFSVPDLESAISANNEVPQGLSSAIFTTSLQSAEHFLSAQGSDCGIANVNIGTSGAEIGGAFGGEKETGGGREAGSDSWKAYMRRQTSTINYGDSLPLAQGVKFDF